MTRKFIRKPSSIIKVLYFCQTCIIWVDSFHTDRVDKYYFENNHIIKVHAYFSFQNGVGKYVSILVLVNRSGHKILHNINTVNAAGTDKIGIICLRKHMQEYPLCICIV